MKLSEIIAHNKANLERCTAKQATFMREYVPFVQPSDTEYLFVSKCSFRKYVRKAGHYKFVKEPVPKYVCTILCWDKDTDKCRCIHQFGFNNRNRLRNRIAELQKNENDIVCRVISLNKED